MAMTISTNVMSLNAQRNLSSTQGSMSQAMQRLSSGMRVSSARDDAAGLAIAERMTSQIRGSNVAARNCNDAISMFQTAEGAMGKLQENLQRVRELAVQAANGAISDEDRGKLQDEVDQLTQEVSRIIKTTKFNGLNLFDGNDTTGLAANTTLVFQVGANSDDQISVDGSGFDLSTTNNSNTPLTSYNTDLTATLTIKVNTAADAATALTNITADIDRVSSARATAGSLQARFEATAAQLQIYSENTSAARGRILDADFATETANLARAQILQQAGTAMVAQANMLPQQVLKLLGN